MKYLAACVLPDVILAVDQEGFAHEITSEPGEKPYIDRQTAYSIEIRVQAKSCSMYTLLILDFLVFQKLCHNIKEYTDEWHREDFEMELVGAPRTALITIKELAYHRAEALHNNAPVTLFYGLSGRKPGDRWRCDTHWCMADNHYNCRHARFASRVIPTEAVTIPMSPEEDYRDLIEDYI